MNFRTPLSCTVQTLPAINTQIQRALQTLNYGAYGHLIQYFTDHRFHCQAKQLHARLVLHSVKPDNFLASKLINFYSKYNDLLRARHVFDEIHQKSVFSYNAMLIAYSVHDMYTETLQLFSSLISFGSSGLRPDKFTITCLIKALSGIFSESRLAKEVHSYVLRCGFDSSWFINNGFITFYSRCDDMVSARTVFDKMHERDIVSWNSMIAGYSQGGYFDKCKELYKEMLNSSVRPDEVTVISVLQACGQSKDLVLGMEVHNLITESGIKLDVWICNALIALYAKCGSLDYARDLFEEMSGKDEVSHGAIISGYMEHGFVEEAVSLFRKMEKPGLSTWNALISGLVQNNRYDGVLELIQKMIKFGVRTNAITLSSILSMFACFSNLKGGKEIHGYALRNAYDRNIYVATAIIDTYAKAGYLHGAKQVFDQCKSRSLVIWTAIISAYAAHGDANMALALLDEMVNYGIQPDHVTFTTVLAACAHSGLVDKAWEIFNAIFSVHRIEPSLEHYACMVGVLSRDRRLNEAVKFITEMPVEPNAKVWGALLNGASVAGDIEVGELACRHLFEIEPENSGNYVVMANLYSQGGRWEEADKVREKVKQIGLKKIAGSSWIESSRGLPGPGTYSDQ